MRFFAVLAALAALPGVALARQGLTPLGNPGELVAAESALAHRAHDKGANAALVAMALDSAELIDPVRTPARTWLKTHDAAAWFVDRQVANVWASCDGTFGVSTGLWQGGWFALVWQRQKKLDFKWLLADAAPLAAKPPAPDWITGKVADCPARDAPMPGPPPAPAGADSRDGRSVDGSLVWRSTVMPDGSRALRVWIWQAGAMQVVLDRATAAGPR